MFSLRDITACATSQKRAVLRTLAVGVESHRDTVSSFSDHKAQQSAPEKGQTSFTEARATSMFVCTSRC